jgi:hypothetical protein
VGRVDTRAKHRGHGDDQRRGDLRAAAIAGLNPGRRAGRALNGVTLHLGQSHPMHRSCGLAHAIRHLVHRLLHLMHAILDLVQRISHSMRRTSDLVHRTSNSMHQIFNSVHRISNPMHRIFHPMHRIEHPIRYRDVPLPSKLVSRRRNDELNIGRARRYGEVCEDEPAEHHAGESTRGGNDPTRGARVLGRPRSLVSCLTDWKIDSSGVRG